MDSVGPARDGAPVPSGSAAGAGVGQGDVGREIRRYQALEVLSLGWARSIMILSSNTYPTPSRGCLRTLQWAALKLTKWFRFQGKWEL